MGTGTGDPYGPRMFTLHIEHRITSYDEWRAAFDRFAPLRKEHGALAERVRQPVDDAQRIVIDLDFATAEQAAAFREVLETRIWTSPASAPALVGRPRAEILAVMS
jgi:hypothetical protein